MQHPVANGPGDTALKKPITGIAGCCACAAAGLAKSRAAHKAMKSLRLMPSIRTLILEGKATHRGMLTKYHASGVVESRFIQTDPCAIVIGNC